MGLQGGAGADSDPTGHFPLHGFLGFSAADIAATLGTLPAPPCGRVFSHFPSLSLNVNKADGQSTSVFAGSRRNTDSQRGPVGGAVAAARPPSPLPPLFQVSQM